MSDRPVAESANVETNKHSSAEENPPQPETARSSHWPAVSRVLTYATLALAVIAVTLAALAYFRPQHHSASVAQQGGDAKANVCAAFGSARKAVVINTHLQSPNPNDPIGQMSVAANARLALIGSGSYLRERLAANTAAPADLANAADSFANTIQQLGINYLTEAAPEIQEPLRADLDSQIQKIQKMCT